MTRNNFPASYLRALPIGAVVAVVACLQLAAAGGGGSSSSSDSSKYFQPEDGYAYQPTNLYFTAAFPGQPELVADASSEVALRQKFLELWAAMPTTIGVTEPGATEILDSKLAANGSSQLLVRLECRSWADATLVRTILKDHPELVQQTIEQEIGPVKFNAFLVGELAGQKSKYDEWLGKS